MVTLDELKDKLADKARLIGLDLGSKRIGVAICDDERKIATPFKTIESRLFGSTRECHRNDRSNALEDS